MQAKLIVGTSSKKDGFEQNLNEFITDNNLKVIDIKFNAVKVTDAGSSEERVRYSALVLYEDL